MPKTKLTGWPWGAGSMQRRGRTWWLIYRNVDGRRVQENSKELDYELALQMLIERALIVAQARVKRIEEAGREAQEARRAAAVGRSLRNDRQRSDGRRSVRHDAALGAHGKRTTTRTGDGK